MAGGSAQTSYSGALAASTVDVVTLTKPAAAVEVLCTVAGTAADPIYFTVGTSINPGPPPTVGGANCYAVAPEAGEFTIVPVQAGVGQSLVVQLISGAAVSYTVMALNKE